MKDVAGQPIHELSSSELRNLIKGGQVFERDKLGEKVVLTSENQVLKLFRPRKFFSSQLWSPYAERFARNALRLRQLNIQGPIVEKIYSIPELNRQAVLYPLIEGESLRFFFAHHKNEQEKSILLLKTAAFLAELHGKGALFDGFHFGNILTTPSGEFALIDITDMTFLRRGKVTLREVFRTFACITRYPQDQASVEEVSWPVFFSAYLRNLGTKHGVSPEAFKEKAASFPAGRSAPSLSAPS